MEHTKVINFLGKHSLQKYKVQISLQKYGVNTVLVNDVNSLCCTALPLLQVGDSSPSHERIPDEGVKVAFCAKHLFVFR
jgi:hypothetical protein